MYIPFSSASRKLMRKYFFVELGEVVNLPSVKTMSRFLYE